jgi:hypothetical protein
MMTGKGPVNTNNTDNVYVTMILVRGQYPFIRNEIFHVNSSKTTKVSLIDNILIQETVILICIGSKTYSKNGEKKKPVDDYVELSINIRVEKLSVPFV